MSPQDLKKLNYQIFEYLGRHPNRRHRLLMHALDRGLLSDSDFQDIRGSRLSEDELMEAPWALALFWGRLFYENSNGNNYRRVLQECLAFGRVDCLFDKIQKVCGWFPKSESLLARNTYSFQAECWLTSSEGESSNLWKSLPQLIRNASSVGTDEEVFRFEGFEEQDITPPLRWLLTKRDPDFCNTLRWLASGGNGDPLSELISQNPINSRVRTKDDFKACFGLRVANQKAEVALKISGIWFGEHDEGNSRELCISQGNRRVFSTSIGRGSPAIILGGGAFCSPLNVSIPIGIKLGNANRDSGDFEILPWGCSSLLLFRQYDDGRFSRYIDCDDPAHPPHVQGRYFYLAGRPGVTDAPVLFHDNRPVRMTPLGEVRNGDSLRRIFQLDLQTLHGEVGGLFEKGTDRPIALIGRKPFLSFCSSASSWMLPGGDETPVFVGSRKLTVKANNFPQQEVTILAKDTRGNILPSQEDPADPMAIIFPIEEGAFGRKWTLTASSMNGGDHVNADILFLPNLDTGSATWLADDVGGESRYFTARNYGLEAGTVYYPGGSTRVLRPIEAPLWSWSEGGVAAQRDFCTPKEFVDHQDAASWWLDYALPTDGDWTFKFNDEEISSVSGKKSLCELLEERLDPEKMANGIEVMDLLRFVHRLGEMPEITIARIFRLPLHPVVGLISEIPRIYIPSNFHSAGWRLVLVRESGLLDDSVTDIPLDNFSAGNVHLIQHLARWKSGEGAWLVLLKSEVSNLALENLTTFAACLSFIEISSVCRVMHEREEQTFLMLLNTWHGDGQALHEDVKQKVRSRLDLLENWSTHVNGNHAAKVLFARSRRQRHLLGYGSREVLMEFFDQRLLDVLRLGADSFSGLLSLLLECGFNCFAEPGWVESLHDRVRHLLSSGSRFTQKMRDALRDTCPLSIAFQKVHEGERKDIHLIDSEFFPQRSRPDIGLSIACPESDVEIFRTGLSWRGFEHDCIRLTAPFARQNPVIQPRKIQWPRDPRNAVCVMDTHGYYGPIILRVLNRINAARYLADRLTDNSSLRLTLEARDRIRNLFKDALRSASSLVGDVEALRPDETQLGVLFDACNNRLEEISGEEEGQECRAVIYQVAVLSRLNAWMKSRNAVLQEWSLDDPIHYDLIAQVISSLWDSPDDRRSFERDIAPIEWLITWFKSPNFLPKEP